jgi:hypothetical protein
MPFLKPQSVDSEITGECNLLQDFDSSEQHAFQQAISVLSCLIGGQSCDVQFCARAVSLPTTHDLLFLNLMVLILRMRGSLFI